MSSKQKYITVLAKNRKIIQAVFGVGIFFGINYFPMSKWRVVGFGSAIGIVWSKVFYSGKYLKKIVIELIMEINFIRNLSYNAASPSFKQKYFK